MNAGVELIPSRWEALGASCTCPDQENPCKHIAAVLYVFAAQLDADPWLLLAWRGRTRDDLLAHLRARPGASALPPWWPLRPGGALPSRPVEIPAGEPPDPPDRVLARLGELAVDHAGRPVTVVVAIAYRRLHAASATEVPGA